MTMPTRFSRAAALRVIAVYAGFGLAIGFSFLPLIPVVRAIGWPRDTSVGIALFGLMPMLIVLTGLRHPWLWVNLVGLLLAMLSWAVGYAAGNLLMGIGSIGFNLAIMAPYVVPGYVALTLVVFVLASRRSCAGTRG